MGLCNTFMECSCSGSSGILAHNPRAELESWAASASASASGLGTRTGTGSGLGLGLRPGSGFCWLSPRIPALLHATASSKSRTPTMALRRGQLGSASFSLLAPPAPVLHWFQSTKPRTRWRFIVEAAADDDFDIEEEIEFDDDNDKGEDDEEDLQDFETDYDVIGGGGGGGRPGSDSERYLESDTFISTRGEPAESIVDYKINEDDFHKLSLQHCDFFIRKVPDADNNVYDFREMYVTAPDTDIYAIPKVDGKLPKNPVRLTKSNYEHFCTTELPVETLRSPMVKNERQVMKIFLMKHLKNRRADAWNFVLDFEQIYVIDSKSRTISRAKVTLNVPGGVNRDRSQEVLLVHEDGTVFTVIPQSKRKTPDDLVRERHWNKTKADMDNYLRSFRDYPISNWF